MAASAIAELDRSTDLVIGNLCDPQQMAAYQSKGLVVGYVQSGKTANFTAVIAKAADIGYRLVIVLAGMLDILRRQTQRRLDKELLGQELITTHVAAGQATITPVILSGMSSLVMEVCRVAKAPTIGSG